MDWQWKCFESFVLCAFVVTAAEEPVNKRDAKGRDGARQSALDTRSAVEGPRPHPHTE